MQKLKASVVILAGLGVLALLATWFSQRWDRWDNAWAYRKPSITGDWLGEAWTGKTRLRLALSLTRDKFDWLGQGDSVDDHRALSGRAVLCDSTGRIQAYSLKGLVKDPQAHETQLYFSSLADEVPGLRPTKMALAWDGSTTFTGEARLVLARAGGATWSSSADPDTGHPISFVFHPASTPGQTCAIP